MTYDPENIFAKVLRGDLPCFLVHEDAETLAFMDIMPQADGHVLVLPREPAETLLDLSDAAARACIVSVKRVAAAVKQAFQAPGIKIVQMNGSAAGQSVGHCHFHVIPCGPGMPDRPHGQRREEDQNLQKFAAQIKACM